MSSRRNGRRVRGLSRGIVWFLGPGVGALFLQLFAPGVASSDSSRPAAPAGVSYSRPLAKGEWLLSYRYERQLRKHLNRGSEYVQVPKRQQIDIHTVAVQWAPFKRLTLSLALPILVNQMKQLGPGAMPYTSSSSGVGDLEFVGIVPFIKKKNETLDIHFGLNIPIDSSNDKRREGELLPYSMQSDSSNWNIIAGLAYRGHHKGLSWGVHATGEIGFGTNDHGYRVGNRIEINGWLGHEITSWLSGTARLGYKRWTRVRHAVSSGPENHPGSYTRNTGSDRLWLGPGLNLALPVLGVQHLSIEALWPVFQSLRGSQLEADWTLTTRWEWIF